MILFYVYSTQILLTMTLRYTLYSIVKGEDHNENQGSCQFGRH